MSKQLKHVAIILMMIMLFMIPSIIFAQETPDPGCDPLDPACPIDGGLTLLIAAGISLGARKSYQLAKKTKLKF